MKNNPLRNSLIAIAPTGGSGRTWTLSSVGGSTHLSDLSIVLPTFHIDDNEVAIVVRDFETFGQPKQLSNGVTEYRFIGEAQDTSLGFEIIYRLSEDSPIVRFRYSVTSSVPRRLNKLNGKDRLTYFETSYAHASKVKEIQLSQFNAFLHSFCLSEDNIEEQNFINGTSPMGPLLVGCSEENAFLLAYEHGSQVPDAFLRFHLAPEHKVSLQAVKGNYHDGQIIDQEHPFDTLWMQAGLVCGGEDVLAKSYRDFVLRDLSVNVDSRKPLIFYNTWAYQERVKAWQQRPYLADMNEARMLSEIEVAHRMGIDVFVIDTGWYQKTGDWRVSAERFPRGMAPIKAKLDEYKMKLGLWFNPTVAAVSSQMRRDHEDCLMTVDGKPQEPQEIWETEASQGLCLVSRYGDAFAQELIRLYREVGVTYFKWDAIGQYGCDAPGHGHGETHNTPGERRQCYGFELGAAMVRVVDTLCAACPDAIVDFDVTEGGRTVGLQFLSAGKYFLINNGPYSHDYNLPTPADGNVNLFFYPGHARSWICRAPLTYDKWIPSVLFLTHYLPDDRYTKQGWSGAHEVADAESQWVNLASLILGQNGIWGDLLAVTDEGVELIGDFLRRYKQVSGDITQSALVRTGEVGGSPEVYEKIAASTGNGAVSLFCTSPGTYTYLTHATGVGTDYFANDGVDVAFDKARRACITARFASQGAKVVLFGVKPGQ